MTIYLGIVVVRQKALTNGDEKPESLLLTGVDHEDARHYVHGLAVTDLRVARGICAQDPSQRLDTDQTSGLYTWYSPKLYINALKNH
jgi:hypothetical protein